MISPNAASDGAEHPCAADVAKALSEMPSAAPYAGALPCNEANGSASSGLSVEYMKQRAAQRGRWQIDASTLQVLESVYQRDPYPNRQLRQRLGEALGATPRQIQIW